MGIEWVEPDRRIAAYDEEFAALAKADVTARRLASIPGIGVLNATALVAAIGDGATVARGRDLAAWLGLVPRQATTSGRPRLLRISKRGNKYLRKLLIHGARALMPALLADTTPWGRWLRGLSDRKHKNAVIVALANKLARIVWAVLHRGEAFDVSKLATGHGVKGWPDTPIRSVWPRNVCWWWKPDGLTVEPAFWKLGLENGRADLHLGRGTPRDGYFSADCSVQFAKSPCRRGGPYVSKTEKSNGLSAIA